MPASSARNCSRLSRRSSGAPAARRSAPARCGGRHRCRYGASAGRRPRGSPRARSTAPATPRGRGRTRRQPSPRSSGLLPPVTRSARPASRYRSRVGQRRQHQCAGKPAGASEDRPAGSPPRRADPAGSSVARAACTRSEPRGSVGSVSTATPPLARTASAISGSPQATATGPISASRARSSTCTIIGRPWMSASGLPGSRVEAMRAGMTTIGFTCARDLGGLMGKGRFPMVRTPYGGERPRATARRRASACIGSR